MNKVILTGRTTKTIELRYTTSNVAVTQFTIAVNRDFKDKDGNYSSDFISCVAYRKTAELLAQYVEKGDKLGIVGRIQTRDYTDKDNNRRYVTEVIVESIEFLEQKKKDSNTTTAAPQQEAPQTDPFAEFGEQVSIDDNFLE